LLIKGDKKKMKNMTYLVVGLLLISGFAAISIGEEASVQRNTISVTFFEPNIVEKETYMDLKVEGTDTFIFDGGNPLLPVRTETITLPFGVTVTDIRCDVQGVQSKVLSKKITPAPQPVKLSGEITISSEPLMNQAIYESEKMYPDNWFSYNVGVGLGENNEHVTFLTIRTYPVRYNPGEDTIYYAEKIDVTYAYKLPETNIFPTNFEDEYKLVIIAPNKYASSLEPLVTHKESMGLTTMIKTTEQIYADYTGYDKPEQIKYFIKDAIETYNTSYVMLVGAMKSFINGVPRDDSSQGTKDWNIPVRYSNLVTQAGDDPGYISDLYYSDIYEEGSVFCSWDSNENHIYGEYKFGGDQLDLYPDVAVGRLPCRTLKEVKDAVEKIKTYETTTYGSDWFNKAVAISGDGFLDQVPLAISWNTAGLPNGEYTIYAQSKNIENVYGPIDETTVTLDKTKETSITFNHDDHLTTGLSYPFPPVAEIVTVSDGDILGNTNYVFSPKDGQAYCNDITGWANIQYNNGILKIGGKTYDPRPYGVYTDIHVWVNNSGGTKVFDTTRAGFKMYWEGEWCTGEELLLGRAGGLYYMPESFDKELVWTSNGKFTGMKDVTDVLDAGCGFAFFSGHGSPCVWADHYPGVPGNRKFGGAYGLFVFNYKGLPFFPMGKLKNENKNPIVVVGGCHNSLFNVSLIPSMLDKDNTKQMHTYGLPTAECWSERLVTLGKTGAIASIGNTGYGYGILNEYCTSGGLDGYITTEFFVQYGTNGYDVLGETHAQSITAYLLHFDPEWDAAHQKSIEQWVLLGDPSLKIGGYPAI
jgi:hypothetical protein